MAAIKKNFQNYTDKKSFPVAEIKQGEKKGVWSFPMINSIDLSNRKRTWCVFVRLVAANINEEKNVNWELDSKNTIKVSPDMFQSKEFPANVIAQIWTESGIVNGKTTRSATTHITNGKNIGKKNENNPFTQALIDARSRYDKQKNKSGKAKSGSTAKMFYTVALHKYKENPRDEKKQLRFPYESQPKMDGGMVASYGDYSQRGKTDFIMYTRRFKEVPGRSNIVKAMCVLINMPFMKDNPKFRGIYFVGEFYKNGKSLQEISGMMRNEAENPLEYHIFDVFFPVGGSGTPPNQTIQESKAKALLTRRERCNITLEIFDNMKAAKKTETDTTKKKDIHFFHKYIKLVPSVNITDRKQSDSVYHNYLDKGFEGAVLRNWDAPYEYGINRETRTYYARKRKPRPSAEFKMVGYEQGKKGKAIGAVMFVMTTAGDKKNAPELFRATPKKDMDWRYNLFQRFEKEPGLFEKEWKGKMHTIEYFILSKNKVPQQPYWISRRDID